MNKVRILQILVGSTSFNGIASSIYQQYRSVDRNKIHFDFFFTKQNSLISVMDDPIFENSKFTVINATIKGSTDYFTIHRKLKDYLKDNNYDYIVVSSSMIEVIAICLLSSRNLCQTQFIAHTHNTSLYIKKSARRNRFRLVTEAINRISKNYVRNKASFLFGCSKDAIEGTFGRQAIERDNILVVRNAVSLEKFRKRVDIREIVRKENDVNEETFVFGSVGRLVPIKNQEFLIKVFSELIKKKKDSKLWIVGQGPEQEKLEILTRKLNLEDNVFFWGQRMDVNQLMQGMDAFILTSLSEGLGIVAIEAQAAGLPTVLSDGVPEEALITKLSLRLPLSEDESIWAKKILEHIEKCKMPYNYEADIKKAGYDTFEAGKYMTDFYVSHKVNKVGKTSTK